MLLVLLVEEEEEEVDPVEERVQVDSEGRMACGRGPCFFVFFFSFFRRLEIGGEGGTNIDDGILAPDPDFEVFGFDVHEDIFPAQGPRHGDRDV